MGSDPMLMALTREISPAILTCELTHLARTPIDLDRARAQHADYEWALVEAGCTVRRLHAADDMPDSVFVEDIAVILDELAVMTRPGAASRRGETPAIMDALIKAQALHFRPLVMIEEPATLDGGDVLVLDTHAFVGASSRTNAAGVNQLRRMLTRAGYTVQAVPVHGCLHLKSAVTAVGPDTVLINPEWVPPDAFAAYQRIEVDPAEPHAANALLLADRVVYPTAFPRTRERLEQAGLKVRPVDVSELAKAEGAVTCCSLIFEV
jgi:dimethylargininase